VFTVRYELNTFTNSTFCPHSVFMCFVWISEQTAIISLYSINWLVFITETECVYCAVRAEIHTTGVSWFLSAVPWVKSYYKNRLMVGDPGSIPGKSLLCDLCWTKWHRYRFCSEYFGFPLPSTFHQCSIHIFVYTSFLQEEWAKPVDPQ
jgi:hypothetical protein